MRRLLQTLREDPLLTSVFLVLWLGTWVLLVLTWETDSLGNSVGMAPAAVAAELLLPGLLGFAATWRRGATNRLSLPPLILGGATFGVGQFVLLAIVDSLWLPAPASPLPNTDYWAGALVGTMIYAGWCMILTPIGGLVGAWIQRPGRNGA